jgi:hypothetical protein
MLVILNLFVSFRVFTHSQLKCSKQRLFWLLIIWGLPPCGAIVFLPMIFDERQRRQTEQRKGKDVSNRPEAGQS